MMHPDGLPFTIKYKSHPYLYPSYSYPRIAIKKER